MSIHELRPSSVSTDDAERVLTIAALEHGDWTPELIDQMVSGSDLVMANEYWDGLAIVAPGLTAKQYRNESLRPAWRDFVRSKNWNMNVTLHHVSLDQPVEHVAHTNSRLKVHIRIFDATFFAASDQPYRDILAYWFRPSALQYWPPVEGRLLRHIAEGDLTVMEPDPDEPTHIQVVECYMGTPILRKLKVPSV